MNDLSARTASAPSNRSSIRVRLLFVLVTALSINGASATPSASNSNSAPNSIAATEFREAIRVAEFAANAKGLFDGALLFGLKADASAFFLGLKGKVVAAYDLRTHKIDLYTARGVGLVAPLNLKEVLRTVEMLGVYSSINVGVSLGYAGGTAYERGGLVGEFSGARVGFARGWGGDLSYYQSQLHGSQVWFALASVEFGIDANVELTSLTFEHAYSER